MSPIQTSWTRPYTTGPSDYHTRVPNASLEPHRSGFSYVFLLFFFVIVVQIVRELRERVRRREFDPRHGNLDELDEERGSLLAPDEIESRVDPSLRNLVFISNASDDFRSLGRLYNDPFESAVSAMGALSDHQHPIYQDEDGNLSSGEESEATFVDHALQSPLSDDDSDDDESFSTTFQGSPPPYSPLN